MLLTLGFIAFLALMTTANPPSFTCPRSLIQVTVTRIIHAANSVYHIFSISADT
ncbi:hypothetical protein [Candidatus Alkanophaga liquidiphilum]